jgi:tetratricopeptide (TPR) repeat protein
MDMQQAPQSKRPATPSSPPSAGVPPGLAGSRGRPNRREPACWRRGLAEARARDWKAASRSFEAAARLMPQDAECWLLLANARRKCGDLDGAIDAATTALRVDPQQGLAWELKLACLQASRRTQDLQQFLLGTPGDRMSREAWLALIEASLRLGKPVDAVSACLQALPKWPGDGVLNYWLGIGLADLGMKAQAAECLRTALLLDLGPMEVGVRDLLAYYERQACDWAAAQEQLPRLVSAIEALSPDQAVCAAPFTHATLLDDPAVQLKAARAHALYVERGVVPLPARLPTASPRLRVGYV